MSQLKGLTELNAGGDKLPPTEVDFIIESFPQLTCLGLGSLGLTGEHATAVRSASWILLRQDTS